MPNAAVNPARWNEIVANARHNYYPRKRQAAAAIALLNAKWVDPVELPLNPGLPENKIIDWN